MKTVRIVIVFLLAAALLCGCGLPQSAQNSPAPEATPASGEPQSAVGEETVVVAPPTTASAMPPGPIPGGRWIRVSTCS